MKIFDANKVRWAGGFGLGIVASQVFREGWGALALLALGIFGRWFLGRLLSALFDDELTAARKHFKFKDPVKAAIWNHANENHDGKWRDCTDPACVIY